MRIVFMGASDVAVMTARSLIKQGFDVVIIERDRERVEELSQELDCGFLHGDATRPAILREADPRETDILFCLSDNDQANIIASLVARSLGFKRVVTSIENPEFEGICHELGLDRTIIPDRTISLHLEDMVRGFDPLELSTILKDKARLFTFTAGRQDVSSVAELNLPEDARVICYYREEQFYFADDNTELQEGDEVIILTHSKNLSELKRRWEPKRTDNHKRS